MFGETKIHICEAMTNRAAIYCRVSTAAQEREGASLDTQLLGCKEVCDGKGLPVVADYQKMLEATRTR